MLYMLYIIYLSIYDICIRYIKVLGYYAIK